jgi:hypothetical protein
MSRAAPDRFSTIAMPWSNPVPTPKTRRFSEERGLPDLERIPAGVQLGSSTAAGMG